MKPFNIIIAGVGGQGLITLLQLIAQAALNEGCDVRTSELHGLSQRGGSVATHIRFGKQVFSPIIPRGKADLVLALELQEALAGAEFASKKTVFLVNKYQTLTMIQDIPEKEVEEELKKVSKNVYLVPASETCKKELGNDVVAGIFLLGYALKNNFLPLKKEGLIEAIKKTMPEKFWELNIKAVNLGYLVNELTS